MPTQIDPVATLLSNAKNAITEALKSMTARDKARFLFALEAWAIKEQIRLNRELLRIREPD